MKSEGSRPCLVVFDLDGTLVNAYPAITESINFMLKRLGRPPQSLKSVTRSVGWGVDGLVRTFVEDALADRALAIFREHHDKRLRRDLKLMPGARSLLDFLQDRDIRLAIASNRPTRFCHIILETLEITGYFFRVVGGDMVNRPKPFPDMLRMVLRESGVPRSRAVYVGDMTVDVICGRRAGVKTVALPTGSCSRQELESETPDILLPGLPAVKAWVKTLS